MSTRRIWTIGCVLVMVVSIALGWVLGISPLLTVAKVADETREAAEAQNTIYSQELLILKEQFAGIEQLEEQLDELRGELPSGADLPNYVRQLSALSQQHSVTLNSITTADAVAYAPATVEAPVEEAAVDAEDAAVDAEDAAAEDPVEPVAEVATDATVPGMGTPVTSPLVTAENFIAIPISVAYTGGYDNVLAFIDSLQTGTRLTAVTAFNTSKEGTDAPSGDDDAEAPAASDAVSGTMSLFVWVLLDPSAE